MGMVVSKTNSFPNFFLICSTAALLMLVLRSTLLMSSRKKARSGLTLRLMLSICSIAEIRPSRAYLEPDYGHNDKIRRDKGLVNEHSEVGRAINQGGIVVGDGVRAKLVPQDLAADPYWRGYGRRKNRKIVLVKFSSKGYFRCYFEGEREEDRLQYLGFQQQLWTQKFRKAGQYNEESTPPQERGFLSSWIRASSSSLVMIPL